MMKSIKVKENQRALYFKDDEFQAIVDSGTYRVWPWSKERYEIYSIKSPEFKHSELEQIHLVNNKKFLNSFKVKEGEMALVQVDGHFYEFFDAGVYAFWKVLHEVKVEIFKVGKAFVYAELEKLYQEKERFPCLKFLEVKDGDNALVTINGNIQSLHSRGLYAFWKAKNEIKVDTYEASEVLFEHKKLKEILKHYSAGAILASQIVPSGYKALRYVDGKFAELHDAGLYAWWKNAGQISFRQVDMREQILEVTGQDIITADKVTLRINALLTFKVKDCVKVVETFEDFSNSLYREVQLILRAMIGTRLLDSILQDKEELAEEVRSQLDKIAEKMGLELISFGVKDIILPGDMKELLNKVTEAKKAAEAALITRREETASMRSQANTAKIMENNPALLKLREMEILEKLSANPKLQIIVGDKSLSEQLQMLV